MKVEKCPRCDAKPLLYTINSADEIRISVWERTCPICEYSEVAITWRGAIRKWNRWARREAKRIAEEGATK